MIVAFLQNQWFRDPERALELLKRYQQHEGGEWEGRERFNRDMLFFGCLTGRQLQQTFGEELCDSGELVWEEVSPKIGDKSSAVFPADESHIRAVLDRYQPSIVLAFGAVACTALRSIVRDYPDITLLQGPHPAGRSPNVLNQLQDMAGQLKELL